MATVVLVSCGKRKLNHAAPAKDLYIGPLFRLSWKYAQTCNPDKIFILSTKHHLLSPERVIEPYDMTLKHMSIKKRKEWSIEVLKELRSKTDIKKDKFVLIAEKPYLEYIDSIHADKEEPLKDLPFEKCISRLKELTKARE
ncbi:hypothetical protein M1567_00880 [Candidatus Marsarchaeota archaeon]|nr:hypothetical protein [Candidatus Marsarchaeota archaeon]